MLQVDGEIVLIMLQVSGENVLIMLQVDGENDNKMLVNCIDYVTSKW